MVNPTSGFLFILSILASIAALIIAMAIPRWVTYSFETTEIHIGLFKFCMENNGCKTFHDNGDSLTWNTRSITIAQVLCIAAIAMYFITLVIVINLIWRKREKVTSMKDGIASFFIALIGAGMNAAATLLFRFDDLVELKILRSYDMRLSYNVLPSWSYYLACSAAPLAFVSGIFAWLTASHFFKERRMQSQVAVQMQQPPIIQIAYPVNQQYPSNYDGNNQGFQGQPPAQVQQLSQAQPPFTTTNSSGLVKKLFKSIAKQGVEEMVGSTMEF